MMASRYSSFVAVAGKLFNSMLSSDNMIVLLVCVPRSPLRKPKCFGNNPGN